MKKIFLLILIFATVSRIHAQSNVSFSVVADADDWQLFMTHKIMADLTFGSGGKAVFITLTAGDEGNGSGGSGAIPYYLARERGSVGSSKFLSEITNPQYPHSLPVPTAQPVLVNGKTLTKYVYAGPGGGAGEIVNYFLRLRDGGPTGAGLPAGSPSLMKLKLGTIPSMTSVDGVNTYTWAQLLNTIRHIIFIEKGSATQVWLNAADLDPVTNPGDHSDHFYSSTAAQEAVSAFSWVGINEFVMNHSSSLTIDLTEQEQVRNLMLESGLFGVYNYYLLRNRYDNKLDATNRAYLGKEAFNVARNPTGSGGALPITLVSFTGTLKGNNVLLEWRTSSELNSKEFQIERSNDGNTYRKLSTVAAAGFSSSQKQYSYLDIEATDINYYRLKMVDQDGMNKQSDVVIVKNSGLIQSVSVMNNPFQDHVNVRFAKIPKGGVTLRLLDLSGKLIQANQSYQPSLSSVIRFDLNSTISKGVYILQVENEGKQYSIKVMKQ
ncbi:MAG TPA: T9SS type A sorting domain-containing protein [Ferruginibacter sp.]|nr:T9SS type A sorting domain-containing protein [Ferruginibacter sp.]